MKNFLPLVLLLSATFAFAEEIKINYDEALVPEYTLPDPLTCNDGTKVTTVEQWEKVRRPEILEQFQREMFGRLPKALREAGNHPDFVTFRVFERHITEFFLFSALRGVYGHTPPRLLRQKVLMAGHRKKSQLQIQGRRELQLLSKR